MEIEQLGRLRAESAAIGGLRGAAQVFMVRGRCLQCDGPVSRRVDEQGDYAAVLPWAHDEPGRDSQHTVTGVLPTA